MIRSRSTREKIWQQHVKDREAHCPPTFSSTSGIPWPDRKSQDPGEPPRPQALDDGGRMPDVTPSTQRRPLCPPRQLSPSSSSCNLQVDSSHEIENWRRWDCRLQLQHSCGGSTAAHPGANQGAS